MPSLVIVGAGEWERYTLPFIQSIQRYADFPIVCVDLGNQYPETAGVLMAHTPTLLSYAEALNIGIRARKSDWYFLCNNDMLITKPLSSERFKELDPDCLYSWVMVGQSTVGFPYLESFSMFVSEKIWESVGEFDENFKPMWFEGADYCYRAQKLGFKMAAPLDRTEWGVYHLEDERDAERKAYMQEHIEQRRANRLYLWRKHGLH